MKMPIELKCPKCGKIRTYFGSGSQVRCTTKTGGCGSKININKKNIVGEQNRTIRTITPMLNIALERLNPPPDVLDEKSSMMAIDFETIAKSSDFQRFIIFLAKYITPDIFKGVSTRKSSEVMTQQFNQKLADYKEVMKELKEVLKKKRRVI